MAQGWWALGSDCQDYLLARVFASIPGEDAKLCRLVSQQWLDASRQGIVSLRPKCLNSNRLVEGFPKLRALDLTRVEDLCHNEVELLFRLKHLTSLRLPLVSDAWMSHFCELTHLQKLNLSSSCQITDRGLMGICQVMTDLTYLNLKRCVGVTEHGLCAVSLLKKLEYLNVSELQSVTRMVIRSLATLPQLTVLKMNDCIEIEDSEMEALGMLRQLTALHMNNRLEHSRQSTDIGLMVHLGMTGQTEMHVFVVLKEITLHLCDLKKLVLTCSPCYTLSGILELSRLTMLEDFRITDVERLSEEDLFRVLGGMYSLKILSIDGCMNLTIMAVARLRGLRHLQSLSWTSGRTQSTPRLDDEALSLLTDLTLLRELVIRGYADFTSRTLHQLTFLTSLTLIGCQDVRDCHFVGITNLVHLKAMEHRYCDGLTDDSFLMIARLKNLESLMVADNRFIDGSRIAALTSLPRLSQITFSHCERIEATNAVHLTALRNFSRIHSWGHGAGSAAESGLQDLRRGRHGRLQYIRMAD